MKSEKLLARQYNEILNKQELATRLGLTQRGIESLVKSRKIPVLRISSKVVRFSWPAVERALSAYEVKAIAK